MAPDGPQGDSTPAKYNLIRNPQQSIFSNCKEKYNSNKQARTQAYSRTREKLIAFSDVPSLVALKKFITLVHITTQE